MRPPEWSRCDRHPVLSARIPVVHEGSVGKASRERGAGDCDTVDSPVYSEIVVLVDNLKPRTYYSFRVSAINGNGVGEPGPPSRRIRTSPAQPPSWVTTASGTLGGGRRGSTAFGGVSRLEDAIPLANRPRAACSGIGACTVLWNEPSSNGAWIESYVVETAMILGRAQPPRAASIDEQASLEVGSEEARKGDEEIGNSGADVGFPQNGSLEKTEPDRRNKSPESVAEAAMGSLVIVPESTYEHGPVKREHEVIKHVVISPTRNAVIKGLTTGVQYAFCVAGTNPAGRGKPGPWSEVVHVMDCADDSD